MRTRIVGLALIAAAFSVVVFGVPLAIGLAQFAVSEEQTSLQRLAGFAARSVQADMSHDRVPTSLPDGPGDAAVALYDDEGERLLGTGPPQGDDPVEYVLSGYRGQRPSDDLVAAVPVTDTDDIIGVVRAAAPVSSVYGKLVPIWLGMAALGGLVVVSAWLLARRLAGRLACPLDRLVADADRLGGGDFGIVSQTTGIAETDRASAALSRTARRLDDLLARERAFSAEASHQLRTPLAGLRLRLESALEQPERLTPSTVEDGLASIDRLERTIEELLALARERQTAPVELAEVASLFAECADEWGARLDQDGRSLRIHHPPDLPAPDASAAAVRQILAVLLDNACLHGAGTVTVSAREAGENAIAIDVADEGEGIRATAMRGAQDSAGMGLPLAQRLAESEGGRLTVGTPASVVTLLLPAHATAERADVVTVPPTPA